MHYKAILLFLLNGEYFIYILSVLKLYKLFIYYLKSYDIFKIDKNLLDNLWGFIIGNIFKQIAIIRILILKKFNSFVKIKKNKRKH